MQVISVSYSRIHCTSTYPYQKSVEDSDTTKASVTSFGFSWNSVCSTGAPSVATNVESSKANDSRVVSMKNTHGGDAFLVLSRSSNTKNPKAFYDFSSFNFRCCCFFVFNPASLISIQKCIQCFDLRVPAPQLAFQTRITRNSCLEGN